jgi:hypothetical protein
MASFVRLAAKECGTKALSLVASLLRLVAPLPMNRIVHGGMDARSSRRIPRYIMFLSFGPMPIATLPLNGGGVNELEMVSGWAVGSRTLMQAWQRQAVMMMHVPIKFGQTIRPWHRIFITRSTVLISVLLA